VCGGTPSVHLTRAIVEFTSALSYILISPLASIYEYTP
jgi:hypothetical protein